MSAHSAGPHGHDEPHGHDHAADDDHDDHHAEPPLPEPKSPGWLPLLGGALFLMALIVFLVSNGSETDPDPAEASPEPSAEVAQPALPANRPSRQPGTAAALPPP